MMKLTNMQMSDEERKEMGEPTALANQPKYPYGLQLNLNDDAIDKLGLPALPSVGQTMMIMARVEIQSVSQYESQASDKERSISLQITDMALAPDEPEESAAKKLYGK